VLVLFLDTKRLKSFEDEYETAYEFIEAALIRAGFFFDLTGRSRPKAAIV